MTFEDINKRLKEKGHTPMDIAHIIGIVPYQPSRYLGEGACSLPLQSVIGIYKHLTFKGEPIMVGYKSSEELEADRLDFEAQIGDNTCKRDLGWLNGSSDFSIELYYE